MVSYCFLRSHLCLFALKASNTQPSSPQAVRYYVAYALSFRNIEEIFKERGLGMDHATLQRWVQEYAPKLEKAFRKRKSKVSSSWRMDETYVKIKGVWY